MLSARLLGTTVAAAETLLATLADRGLRALQGNSAHLAMARAAQREGRPFEPSNRS